MTCLKTGPKKSPAFTKVCHSAILISLELGFSSVPAGVLTFDVVDSLPKFSNVNKSQLDSGLAEPTVIHRYLRENEQDRKPARKIAPRLYQVLIFSR